MRKKLLGVFGILFVVAMLTTPLVSAKPTSAANNSKAVSFVWYSENGIGQPPETKINPPWAEPEEVIVSHIQRDWKLNPEGNNYVQIGEDPQIGIEGRPQETLSGDNGKLDHRYRYIDSLRTVKNIFPKITRDPGDDKLGAQSVHG